MIGNLRGAGGFGMGKGKTPNDAINSAFRAALRNILHIDLYDNFGLAHDLHGKHNACHAYIKATSRARAFVGSNFAQEILSRFGISSASVKLVGRRNPYSMVRAIFNALEKHENIDEYARNRGKRYLSIKWAYDNAI
jgi:small subunit ribosomal protein S5